MILNKRESIVSVFIITCQLIYFASSATPGGRYGSATWYYDNRLWMYGGRGLGQNTTSSGLLSDMWSYDIVLGVWTFEGGNKEVNMASPSVALGVYSPTNNPGGVLSPCTWKDTVTNELWMFGGQSSIPPNEAYTSSVWKFDPNITQWAEVYSSTSVGSYGPVDFYPGPRMLHQCVAVGSSIYVSGGYGYLISPNPGYLNDLWYFDAANSTNPWSWISGNDTDNCAGTLSAFDTPSATEYPSCGTRLAGWATSTSDIFFVTGQISGSWLNEVSQYTVGNPSTWTLLHPGDLTARLSTASTSSGSRAWLYGGGGVGTDGAFGHLSDLLEWDGTTWTYLSGANTTYSNGSYPEQPGLGNSSTYPSSRELASLMRDGDGNLWLFGGVGRDSTGTSNARLNDLWKYTRSTNTWTWMSGSKVGDQNGDYTITQPVAPVSPPLTPPTSPPINPPQQSTPVTSPVGPPVTAPIDVPSTNVTDPGLNKDAQIAIGVVVPGVAIGAGLLLLLLLLKRHKKRKATKPTRTTSVPLSDFKPDPRYAPVDTTDKNYLNIDVPPPNGQSPYVATPATESNRLIPYASVTLDKEIGEGSFGKVYLGKLRTTKVAIKVANTKLPQDEFIREANFQLAIPPHPNIVQLLGISVDGPQPLVILEYCNEGSLDTILFKTQKLRTPAEQIALAEAIARGIDHLHQNNIVHRDLAARNILLHHGEPKISDFGMSRKLKEVSQVGKTATTIGPLRWMAPEALGRQLYSAKSDVWSFGMILYEIVAHEEPHEHEDLINVAIAIRDEGYAPSIPDDCPPVLRDVMQKCWKADPDQRPDMGTICALLEDNARQ